MSRFGNKANFSCFLTFQTLKCNISQNVRAKPCGFIQGIHVLQLNVPEKFHYLSPKDLNVTNSSSVPTFFCGCHPSNTLPLSNFRTKMVGPI